MLTTFLDFRFCCRNILWLFTMLRSIDSISWCPFYHRYTYYSLHIYNTLYYFYVISFSWKLCVRVGALEHLLWELIIKNGNYSWIKLRISSDEHQLYSTMFEKCMLALKNKIVLIIEKWCTVVSCALLNGHEILWTVIYNWNIIFNIWV